MAYGKHWEWRGFGVVSADFVHHYSRMIPHYRIQDVEDLYLWIPGLEVNAKFRVGAEGGLKFKRLLDKDGSLELWLESPEDVFDFPLTHPAWKTLSDSLVSVGVQLASFPVDPPDREATLKHLEEAGCQSQAVHKRRESRLWQAPNGEVIVEWTRISRPQPLLSIGLETWNANPDAEGLPGHLAKEDLLFAVEELGLNDETLSVMNYMEAVNVWAQGGLI